MQPPGQTRQSQSPQRQTSVIVMDFPALCYSCQDVVAHYLSGMLRLTAACVPQVNHCQGQLFEFFQHIYQRHGTRRQTRLELLRPAPRNQAGIPYNTPYEVHWPFAWHQDYYLYADFTENPGNMCYILPGAACEKCLEICQNPDPPESARLGAPRELRLKCKQINRSKSTERNKRASKSINQYEQCKQTRILHKTRKGMYVMEWNGKEGKGREGNVM